jgi:hypothetical protein
VVGLGDFVVDAFASARRCWARPSLTLRAMVPPRHIDSVASSSSPQHCRAARCPIPAHRPRIGVGRPKSKLNRDLLVVRQGSPNWTTTNRLGWWWSAAPRHAAKWDSAARRRLARVAVDEPERQSKSVWPEPGSSPSDTHFAIGPAGLVEMDNDTGSARPLEPRPQHQAQARRARDHDLHF